MLLIEAVAVFASEQQMQYVEFNSCWCFDYGVCVRTTRVWGHRPQESLQTWLHCQCNYFTFLRYSWVIHSSLLQLFAYKIWHKTGFPRLLKSRGSGCSIFILSVANKTCNNNIISFTKAGNQKGKCQSCWLPIAQTE